MSGTPIGMAARLDLAETAQTAEQLARPNVQSWSST